MYRYNAHLHSDGLILYTDDIFYLEQFILWNENSPSITHSYDTDNRTTSDI